MENSTRLRRPRVLVGQGRGLSKCVKCGVAFVAKHPAEQTCSKCAISHKHAPQRQARFNQFA